MKTYFKVEGMHCGSCANRVEKSIRQLPGIGNVEIDVAVGKAEVNYDSTKTDAPAIQRHIVAAGYRAQAL